MPAATSRAFSLVLALACTAVVILAEGIASRDAAACLVFVLPLSLIWFANGLENFAGCVGRGGNIDTPTPAGLISGLRWIILIVLAVLAIGFR